MAKNWLDLGLSADQEKQVQEGAALYRATYLDTIDNVFKIAKAIEILRTANYGTGVQGGFAEALVQYGFTDRDGGPMDKGIRSNFKALLDHEADVRAWWAAVPARRKRDWLSGRAIFRHWKADQKSPEQRAAEKAKRDAARLAYRDRMAALAQPQDWVAKPKPPAEVLEAKQAANAEQEAAEMAAKHEVAELQARVAELEAEKTTPTWAALIEHALALLGAMPDDQRHDAIKQWASAVAARFPRQPQRKTKGKTTTHKPKARRGGSAE